jgi:membrane protein DedA with SNARE-associated domain
MDNWIAQIFSQYAYQPLWVYGAIWFFMILSAFGLPLPEEVVLISAGYVGYMSLHPDEYPPPTLGAPHVNVYLLAFVALGAVVGSDLVIFYLGHRYGRKILRMKFFARLVSEQRLDKIQAWTQRYGFWTVPIFRFTPGIRFPGHLMCGAMGLQLSRYLAVDFTAAALTIPTQILLISFYGKVILDQFVKFKYLLIALLISGLCVFFARKFLRQKP